ncbi:uncharacterized protein [Ptychodera flava]|uniref:uncharacterized protein n=1 Tax=Ptychodera flava TaxID=63121 RepID=UPI00396A52C9
MGTYRTAICAALVTVLLNITVTDADLEVVRLVGGETPYEGRVEVFIQKEWLPVLYYRPFENSFIASWDFTSADILCNELGHKGAMSYGFSKALSGDTRMANIRCDENHESLLDCDFDTYNDNYYYYNAATVKCNYDAYLGCYSDLDRNVPPFINGLTIQRCLEWCLRQYYAYAGLHDRSHCVCYNETQYRALTKESGDQCLTECNGDGNQTCGGYDAVGIYFASMGSCGGHVVGTGTIYSPGFPGYYMDNQECTWHVSAQQPKSILGFEFVLFKVDEERDSVTLYEMMSGGQRILEVSNYSATSCSNTVYVTFKSEINDGTRRGLFALKYREVPACPLLPSRVDGTLYYNGSCPYLIGETVSITCKIGFKLSSPHHTIKCQQNAAWNGTLPKCIGIDCGNPGEVENADRIGTQYTYNSTVIYTCHDGYYTNGNRTIRCTIEGRWTEKPSCFSNDTRLSESVTASITAVDCGNPGEVENADRIGTQYSYNSTVIYTCHDGYYTNGSGPIRCTIEGWWTEKPFCFFNDTQLSESVTASTTAVDCGNPGEVENADRIGTQYSYNRTVMYTCHDGYYINGNRTIRCTIEGQWTERPSCFFNDTQLSENVTASKTGTLASVTGGIIAFILIAIMTSVTIYLCRRRQRVKHYNNQHENEGAGCQMDVFDTMEEEEVYSNQSYDSISDAAVKPHQERSDEGVDESEQSVRDIQQPPYENLDATTLSECFYTGPGRDTENPNCNDQAAAENNAIEMTAYTALDPALMGDRAYCAILDVKKSDNKTVGESDPATTYESLRPTLKSDHIYTTLHKPEMN